MDGLVARAPEQAIIDEVRRVPELIRTCGSAGSRGGGSGHHARERDLGRGGEVRAHGDACRWARPATPAQAVRLGRPGWRAAERRLQHLRAWQRPSSRRAAGPSPECAARSRARPTAGPSIHGGHEDDGCERNPAPSTRDGTQFRASHQGSSSPPRPPKPSFPFETRSLGLLQEWVRSAALARHARDASSTRARLSLSAPHSSAAGRGGRVTGRPGDFTTGSTSSPCPTGSAEGPFGSLAGQDAAFRHGRPRRPVPPRWEGRSGRNLDIRDRCVRNDRLGYSTA